MKFREISNFLSGLDITARQHNSFSGLFLSAIFMWINKTSVVFNSEVCHTIFFPVFTTLKLTFDFLYFTVFPTMNAIDIDECSSSDGNKCPKNTTCINNHGSYECRCKKGFDRDGFNCQGIKCHLVHSQFV